MPRRRRLTPEQYVVAGRTAILELLDQEHAATWQEIQAKVADRPWRDDLPAVDPHHLTTARRELTAERRIAESGGSYRGREIPVLHLHDLSRRRTAFNQAASRKRVLTSRYLGWAASTPQLRAGRIGAGAETVVHTSLMQAAPYGYRVVRPEGGDVSTLLGQPVEGGPLDDAAFLQTFDRDGSPGRPLLVVIEVKNLRQWIYPRARELYQLLYKAARLQERSGDVDVVPVLVARRRHYLTYQHARALGFVAFETGRQFLHPGAAIASAKLREVRVELGFIDLISTDQPDDQLVRLFEEMLPAYGRQIGRQWREGGSQFAASYDALRGDLSEIERSAEMDELSELMADAGLAPEW